jgi:signal transduction histidine kinase
MLDPLQQIRLVAERASTFTRQLATFSRGRLDEEEPLELDRTIERLLPAMRRLLVGRAELAFQPGSSGSWIAADPDRFERALMNLLANARDAMPAGGIVRIATRAVTLADGEVPTLGLLPPGPYVEIAVTDNGAGMDEDTKARLFEPFFTTRRGGTGLGLAIAKNIVEGLGGTIAVSGGAPAGTDVRITLPHAPPQDADRTGA